MRMDTNLNVTAKDLLNALSEKELALIFKKYGEERYSNLIAKHIKRISLILIQLEILHGLFIK